MHYFKLLSLPYSSINSDGCAVLSVLIMQHCSPCLDSCHVMESLSLRVEATIADDE